MSDFQVRRLYWTKTIFIFFFIFAFLARFHKVLTTAKFHTFRLVKPFSPVSSETEPLGRLQKIDILIDDFLEGTEVPNWKVVKLFPNSDTMRLWWRVFHLVTSNKNRHLIWKINNFKTTMSQLNFQNFKPRQGYLELCFCSSESKAKTIDLI